MPGIIATLLLALGSVTLHSALAESPALPEPLTLEQALAMADRQHPAVDLAQAQLGIAQARRMSADAQTGLRAHVDLSLRAAEPSTDHHSINDSYARFRTEKPLYDFGRTRALVDAADAEIASREYGLLATRLARRIEIQAAFYAVVLADMRYAVDNEAMAHRYVRYDRVREAHELGGASDVELLEAENHYLEALDKRTASASQQRLTRQQLALALNLPDQLPGELQAPPVNGIDREIPESDTLFAAAITSNPQILALQRQMASALSDVRAARARRNPVLSADLELAEYARDLSSRNNVSVGLNLHIPLLQGGETAAALASANAGLNAHEAELSLALHALRQRSVELVMKLQELQVQRGTARQRLKYRELNLDRYRALYEMEVETSLGSALTQMTEADWQAARVEFSIALTWAEIDALQGLPAPQQQGDTPL